MTFNLFILPMPQHADLSRLIEQAFSILLYITAAFFMLRMLVLVVIGQIDLGAGRPGALGDLLIQVIYALLALVLALNAKAIQAGLVRIFQADEGLLTSGDLSQLGLLIQPMLRMLLLLALTLAVATALVGLALNAIRGQVAILAGSHTGLGDSLVHGLLILAVFGLGVLAIVAGSRLLRQVWP